MGTPSLNDIVHGHIRSSVQYGSLNENTFIGQRGMLRHYNVIVLV